MKLVVALKLYKKRLTLTDFSSVHLAMKSQILILLTIVTILRFRTARSGQTVYTQIRLLEEFPSAHFGHIILW